MKTSRLRILALVVLLSGTVAAQNTAKPEIAQKPSHSRQTKVVRLRGRITADGARFIEDTTQKTWRIVNLEMGKGYEGQPAILRGHIDRDTSTVQILLIAPPTTYTANWSDSAFRR